MTYVFNIIGGADAGAGNLISGNPRGVNISTGGTETWIAGNTIGTDVSGQRPLGNSVDGVALEPDSTNTLVGGTVPGAGNRIAFSGRQGVRVSASSSSASISNRSSLLFKLLQNLPISGTRSG